MLFQGSHSLQFHLKLETTGVERWGQRLSQGLCCLSGCMGMCREQKVMRTCSKSGEHCHGRSLVLSPSTHNEKAPQISHAHVPYQCTILYASTSNSASVVDITPQGLVSRTYRPYHGEPPLSAHRKILRSRNTHFVNIFLEPMLECCERAEPEGLFP